MIRKCWDTVNGNEEDEYIVFDGFSHEFVCFVKAKKIKETKEKEIAFDDLSFVAGETERTYYFETIGGFNGAPKIGDYIVVCYNDNGLVDYVMSLSPETFNKQWVTEKPKSKEEIELEKLEDIRYINSNFNDLYGTLNNTQKELILGIIERFQKLELEK